MDNKEFRASFGEKAILIYYARHCTAAGKLDLSETHSYMVEVIDVWNMTRETVLQNVSGHVNLRLPGREGIAVLATACSR